MPRAIEKKRKEQGPLWMFTKWLFFAFLIAACGGIVPPKSELKPQVESTVPADQAQDVVLNKSVSVTFNKEMALLIVGETFSLVNDTTGGLVPGNITPTGATEVFKPTGNLTGGTAFTATVAAEAVDLFGTPLGAPHSWRFTTAPVGSPLSTDITPPTVVSTKPGNGTKNVPTNTSITATFSEEIDPATVTALTFSVSKGTNAKEISVSGKVATFVPLLPLALGKDYAVTITGGVKDLAGNALSADFIWSFSTGPEPLDD